jgi:hypothetical protein
MSKNKTKTTTITVSRDDNGFRCVNLERRNHYFVSDLVEAYGSGFLKKLSNPPVIKRIKDGNNSQSRRLVSSTDFKSVCTKFKLSPKKNLATTSAQ